MGEPLTQALSELFSLSGLIAFLLGMVATHFYYYVRCRYLDRSDPDGKPHRMRYKSTLILWALIIVTTGYIGVQQFETKSNLYELTIHTSQCQADFNNALTARAAISADNDKWSAIQRKAIADWLHEILLPPPDIQEIRNHDPQFGTNPRYVQWSIDVTTKYYNVIQKAQDEQDQNAKERADHPLPEPTCGR